MFNTKALSALAGAAFLAGPQVAQAGDLGSTVDEARANASLAIQWFEGTLDDYNAPEVTYDGEPFVLRSSSQLPVTSGLTELQKKGWTVLETMSNGKIRVDATWSGAVHGVQEGRRAVRTGLSDHAPCYSVYNAADYTAINALSLPFLLGDAHEAAATAEHLYARYFKEEFERFGVKLMRYSFTSPYHLYNNKPVKTLEDLKGLKVRAGGGTHAKIIAALGATQISLPATELYTAMQRGMIDAVHLSDASTPLYKLDEVAQYRTENGFNVLALEHCLSVDWFEALPDDLKAVVEAWGRQMAIAEAIVFYDLGSLEAVEQMKANGLEVIELSGEERARWEAAASSLTETWITEATGVPAAEIVHDLRETAAKYEAMSPNDIMRDAIEDPATDILN